MRQYKDVTPTEFMIFIGKKTFNGFAPMELVTREIETPHVLDTLVSSLNEIEVTTLNR